jgi:hypothetical protein
MTTRLFTALAVLPLLAAPLRAQRPAPPGVTGDFVIRDFTFADGERLDSLSIH